MPKSTPEQNRIARDLHQGSSGHPYDKLVYVKAGDVIEVINAFRQEQQRADVAETKLAALQPAAVEAADVRS